MKKRLIVLLAAVLGLTLISSLAFAAGFALPEQSTSAMGLSSAFVAQADDPSAAWYNPAAITRLDGTQVSGGLIPIYPILTHNATNGYTDVSVRDIHLPFHLYMTHKYNDKISTGLSINNPFGLSTTWEDNSTVRYVATFSKIITTEVNPTVAYKISDNLSVAAGIAYVKVRATMEKKLNFGALGDQNFRLSGDGDGWGANAAVLYKAASNLDLGLSYRSRVKVAVDGEATVDVPGLLLLGLPFNPGTNSAQTEIVLPDLIQFGGSYKANDNLTLNADIGYTWWKTYDRLVITSNTILELTTDLAAMGVGAPTNTSIDEKEWKNTWTLRLGAQYKLNNEWKLRIGYVNDQTPVQEERYFETRVPDANRQGYSIGSGYTMGKMTIDTAYQYIRFNTRTITNSSYDNSTNPAVNGALNGTYKSTAHLIGVTVGYKF